MKEKKKFLEGFASKHIVIFSIVFIVMDLLLLSIPATVVKRFSMQEYSSEFIVTYSISHFMVGLFFLWIIYLLGDIKKIGLFSAKGFCKGMLLGLPILVLYFYVILGYYYMWNRRNTTITISAFLLPLLFYFMVAFYEEIVIRGAFYLGLRKHGEGKKSVIIAVIVSSVYFGVLHINNGFETKLQACLFVINATVMGIFWASIFINVKNIWVTIVLHMLADYLIRFPYVLFPSSYAQYATAEHSINKLAGTTLLPTDITAHYVILNIVCLPILIAAIIYLKNYKAKKVTISDNN